MAGEIPNPPDAILNPVQKQARRFFEAYLRAEAYPALVAEKRAGVTEAFLELSDLCIAAGIVKGDRAQPVGQNSALPFANYISPGQEPSDFQYAVFLPRKKQLYAVRRVTYQLTEEELNYIPEAIRTPDPKGGTKLNVFRGFDEIGIEIVEKRKKKRNVTAEEATQESLIDRSTMILDGGMAVSLIPLGKDKGRLSVEQVMYLLNTYLDKEFHANEYGEEPKFPLALASLGRSLIDYDAFYSEADRVHQQELKRELLGVISAFGRQSGGEVTDFTLIGHDEDGLDYYLLTKTGSISPLSPKSMKTRGRSRTNPQVELDPASAREIDPTLYREFARIAVQGMVKNSKKGR